jgi:hypothetical protein
MSDFAKESTFKLHIEGPNASEAEKELSSLIEDEFGQRPIRMADQKPNANDHKVVDTLSVALSVTSLILSVPAAIVAVSDLIERVKKKKVTDRLIQWAQEYYEKNPNTAITITTPEGTSFELRKAETVDILDAAQRTAHDKS